MAGDNGSGDTYYDLGTFTWPVTTRDPQAQLWFDRGMAWCYGFNHDEAIACFERALEHDPGCAMAHWGIAYAVGPNYNKPWEDFDDDDLSQSLDLALTSIAAADTAAAGGTDVERALIGALARRFPSSADEPSGAGAFADWNDAYADAMRAVHRAHPDDLDVGALFAEAVMNRTPWALWDLVTGEPAEGAGTLEAVEVLEQAFADLDASGAGRHPGLLHMYIHLMEMSPHPERALKAGDTLVDLIPDAGHLVHMPTHIDVLCGHYQNVVARNHAAVVADRRYLEHEGPANFYTLYRCHNYHFKAYGAMFLGQYGPAMEAAEEMVETLPAGLLGPDDVPLADWLEGFVPVSQHVLIRFGKWQEILDQPLPDDGELYCVTTAMMRYARAVAYASTGRVAEAEQEREAFLAARDRVPGSRMLFNNTCLDILAVAGAMMTGEVEYRKGNLDAAFEHLHRAVELDDNLPYDEPWGWMQPTRHALGALLMEQGRLEEAEAAYRADLGLDGQLRRACRHPDNVWSLHGLHECLTRRGETVEAGHIKQRLDLAVARADVPIESSCYCRLDPAA
ncbi:MAG: tetratricopeptide repeat protein [Acidimicrobiaceae bacterium]|nr:tetratricopeptide repeat protein [Acidimicrobiaceae bacterium]